MIHKNTICVWYDKDAEAAARFYAKTFPDSALGEFRYAPGDYPASKQGEVQTVEFIVCDIPCVGLNGGPRFKHSEAFSFQITTDDQAETDRLWNAVVGNGGQENQCGWCKDKWGVSWQFTPRVLIDAVTGSDPAAAKRAFEAMMPMKKDRRREDRGRASRLGRRLNTRRNVRGRVLGSRRAQRQDHRLPGRGPSHG